MKRVLVIGSPGAGKSTFSRRLREKTALPLIYLDQIWHRPDRSHIPREEFDTRLAEILKGDAWIIDGNYARTLSMRLARADTVFLFDLPAADCLAGAASRIGKKREDMPWIEETFDEEFRAWIEAFPRDTLPGICEALRGFHGHVILFHSHSEADTFLEAEASEICAL